MCICVAGAGPAGLVTLRTFEKRLRKTFPDMEVVCYEGHSKIGGEWVTGCEKPDTSKYGFPIRGSQYDYLRVNTHKEGMQIDEEFPPLPNMQTFSSRKDYLAYLEAYADKFDLRKNIKFSKLVTNVERGEGGKGFVVEVRDLKDDSVAKEKFDYVCICTGNYRKPFIPTDVDISKFTGEVTHYHHLHDPKGQMAGKRVLIIGSSFGAMDMMLILLGSAKTLTISYHNHHKPLFYRQDYADRVTLAPQLVGASGNTVNFVDGSSAEVDVIIYTTSLKTVHPLSEELNIDFSKYRGYQLTSLFPLYKHVVHPGCPQLFFIGKCYFMYYLLFRLQAELCCAIMEGKVTPPSAEEMQKDIEKFQAKWKPELATIPDIDITKYFPVLELEKELGGTLAQLAGAKPLADDVCEQFYAMLKIIEDDCLNYRRSNMVVTPDNKKVFVVPK